MFWTNTRTSQSPKSGIAISITSRLSIQYSYQISGPRKTTGVANSTLIFDSPASPCLHWFSFSSLARSWWRIIIEPERDNLFFFSVLKKRLEAFMMLLKANRRKEWEAEEEAHGERARYYYCTNLPSYVPVRDDSDSEQREHPDSWSWVLDSGHTVLHNSLDRLGSRRSSADASRRSLLYRRVLRTALRLCALHGCSCTGKNITHSHLHMRPLSVCAMFKTTRWCNSPSL